MVEDTGRGGRKGVMVKLDFEKAYEYDRASRDFWIGSLIVRGLEVSGGDDEGLPF